MMSTFQYLQDIKGEFITKSKLRDNLTMNELAVKPEHFDYLVMRLYRYHHST